MGGHATHQPQDAPPARPRPVELHWMKEPDLVMHLEHGLAAPALCGVWMEPDERLAEEIDSGAVVVEYVSCRRCDVLHEFGERADEPPLSA